MTESSVCQNNVVGAAVEHEHATSGDIPRKPNKKLGYPKNHKKEVSQNMTMNVEEFLNS